MCRIGPEFATTAVELALTSTAMQAAMTDGTYKTVGADAYKLGRALGIDNAGRVLVGGTRKDNTGRVCAVWIKP